MDYNYHAHTTRCGHATGTPEEYIETAIAGGIQYMGFSDHAPFRFPDGYESYFRVPMAEAEEYISQMRQLREKYRGKIELSVGFEMEYYPAHFTAMLETARNFGAEYLILGQHFLGNERPNGFHTQDLTDQTEYVREYVTTVIEGMKTGVFTYVAHPDIFKYNGDMKVYADEMRKICVASRDLGIPLEINFLGIRRGRNYPNAVFWELAGKEQCPVTFGFDAHETESACDRRSQKIAEELVEKYSLNYIGRPKLISIA